MKKKLVIAIDGPAGSGKSTVSKILAERLGYLYLDTGALYRSVAYLIGKAGIREDDEGALEKLLTGADIRLQKSPTGMRVEANGEDVSAHLRSEEVGLRASRISARPLIRKMLLPIQRAAGFEGEIVAEGRDMGTVVFPEAEIKFFLDANEEKRISRRFNELSNNGKKISQENIAKDLQQRDRQDRERAIAPLRPHEKAIIIDTTEMTIAEVVETMLTFINRYLCREFA